MRFNVLLLTFKVLHGLGLGYLQERLPPTSNADRPVHVHRRGLLGVPSARQCQLAVPRGGLICSSSCLVEPTTLGAPSEPLLNEDTNLMLHLQRFENTLSLFFNHLASKVHKNEQRTSVLQVRGLLVDVHNSFLLEVNKQWDHHFRSMKQQYEQKITDLRQKFADSQKALAELETEREQKQRDFDRKLLLAKSKIEEEEAEKEKLGGEVKDLKHKVKFLQDQLVPITRQREYQEKEILRLNKALEEVLNFQAPPRSPSATDPSPGLRHQEVMTQNELLKQQVKIFEEDFQRERSDRERMNEEKEELKKKLEKLQKQLTLTNNQVENQKNHSKFGSFGDLNLISSMESLEGMEEIKTRPLALIHGKLYSVEQSKLNNLCFCYCDMLTRISR
uniref:TNFAIP3-interacting protein 1 n=1 Tax=Naja naja TaxID=35670 RepID=A0A8C6XWG7_NAJNA